MAVIPLANQKYVCQYADPKPTSAVLNSELWESDTGRILIWNGTDWVPRASQGDYKFILINDDTNSYLLNEYGQTVNYLAKTQANNALLINQALNALTPGRTLKETVKLRGFYTSTKIQLPSYTRLDLSEAYLKAGNSIGGNLLVNNDIVNGNTDIEIEGGFIHGNRGSTQQGGEDTHSTLTFNKCTNVMIHHLNITRGAYYNVRIRDCPYGIVFTNNISTNPINAHFSDHAIGAIGPFTNVIISNNFFFNDEDPLIGGATFIETLHVDDVVVMNNTLVGQRSNTMASTMAITGLRNVVVGNTLGEGGGGIAISQGVGSDFDTSGSIIANNVIRDINKYGIYAMGAAPGTKLVISGNIFEHNDTDSHGIVVQDWKQVTINDNIVRRAMYSGICVSATPAGIISENIVIANNVISNCGQSLSANDTLRVGISCDGSSADFVKNVIIQNNRCYDDQGTKTQKYGIRLENCLNATIRDNDLRGNLTGAFIELTSTGTKIHDNLGYVTESQGATSVADGGTISHGLASTPRFVKVSPRVASEIVSVTARGASTFTVAIKTESNGAGTTQIVDWRAWI